ncbi:P-loop containing nucleoside triphosphate hydrolase protein [Dioscorea alata]|uniref:P-loop containing nucleoside triphosphate hydrolase protein n=1 Tax=Dioscorea alata TaxID=55571 RepID=A0ACB7VA71_DIOAL|nr:P-loop containing nucleoside triphosphate hydrolase protein [Dioscorea alata]
MCHGSLTIELGDWVNFITGQNGSAKSAILAALCVAFGCRAKGTQRASSLKDFIKNGCNYAAIFVEIKNQGEEAFKHETYGDLIILERRITESTSSTILKDYQERKVATRRDELRELVEHFNDIVDSDKLQASEKSQKSHAILGRSAANGIVSDQGVRPAAGSEKFGATGK